MLKNCKVDFLGNSEVAFFLCTLLIDPAWERGWYNTCIFALPKQKNRSVKA